MEPPANTSPASSKELGQLEKVQPLGEAANLGCPGFETPNAITTAIPGGPATALTAATQGGAEAIETSTGKT